MSLERGTSFGHYTIEEPIGRGGMGEVYRARDTKLGRDVAIKVLPEALSRDKERKDRFEREARLLAQLNHPNIATLHGLEEHAGQLFLVMEMVEGETLAERIARGPLPLDEAVSLFIQIAEGLEAAHEKGVIHRDLKPANLKITPEGQIKILDFGLAKAFAPEQDVSAETSQSPTLTKGTRLRQGFGEAGTQLGAILGTAGYMSPDQARGIPVDKRTDVWSFGCCFYEALTGRGAFEGKTSTDIIAAVVHEEPRWEILPRSTPAGVRELIGRCLQKDARMRLRDVGDARIQLVQPAADEPTTDGARRLGVSWIAAGAAVLAAVLLTWFLRSVPLPPALPVAYLSSSLEPEEKLRQFIDIEFPLSRAAMVLSHDGHYFAFTSGTGVRPVLYVRRLGEPDGAVALPGTDGAVGPFFSPDDEWIGFWTDGKLKKIRVDGGPTQSICDSLVPPNGASWGRDGTILFGANEKGIFRVSADGGEPRAVTTLAEDEQSHGLPSFLPGGDAILYSSVTIR